MSSAEVTTRDADEMARLARLLKHPLRIRVMHALVSNGPGSATTLSAQLGNVTVGDCHYHLTKLRDGGLIKLAGSRPVRGATERTYRLAPVAKATAAALHLRQIIDLILPAETRDQMLADVSDDLQAAGGCSA